MGFENLENKKILRNITNFSNKIRLEDHINSLNEISEGLSRSSHLSHMSGGTMDHVE